MPSPFCLRPIRGVLYMTAQYTPIQLIGPLWTGALIGQATKASASGRRSPHPPETAEPFGPCCHHLEQNPPPVGTNLMSIACPYDRQSPPSMSISN
jgi:hypothetical protein